MHWPGGSPWGQSTEERLRERLYNSPRSSSPLSSPTLSEYVPPNHDGASATLSKKHGACELDWTVEIT